jgi:hypothetical protein
MTQSELRLAIDLAKARKQINLLTIALNDLAAQEQDRIVADLEQRLAAMLAPAPAEPTPSE